MPGTTFPQGLIALSEERIGELGDLADDVIVAGGGVNGQEEFVGSFVGVEELAGHGERNGVVVAGMDDDEAGIFQAADALAIGEDGPDERGEAAEVRVKGGAFGDAGVSGGGDEDGEVVLFGQVRRRPAAEGVAENEGGFGRCVVAGLGLPPDGFGILINTALAGPSGGAAVAAVVVDIGGDAFFGEPFGDGVVAVHGAGVAMAEDGGADPGARRGGGGPAAEMDLGAIGGWGEEVGGVGGGRIKGTGRLEEFGVNLEVLGEDED